MGDLFGRSTFYCTHSEIGEQEPATSDGDGSGRSAQHGEPTGQHGLDTKALVFTVE